MALIHMNFFSEVLGKSSQMEVILPQDTEGQIGIGHNQKETWPVLYLLHGMTDNETTWQRNTSIERYAAEKGLAVVMPTCNLGWYTDMKHGFRYYTYIAHEVPELCQRFFPRISGRREDTFIAGNSMGGYGAFKIALKNPGRFAAAVSLSGALDMLGRAERNSWPGSLYQDVFGSIEEIRENKNDLFLLAEEAVKNRQDLPSLYLWCGTEDFCYGQNVKMRDYLKSLPYPDAACHIEEKGDHSWKYWDTQIEKAIDWLLDDRKDGMDDGTHDS